MSKTPRVRHFGNTANNAYYNAMILRRFAGIESDLPIHMFGLQHAMSAPAWEAVDFDVADGDWVAHPDWSMVPGAVEVNAEYADLPRPDTAADTSGVARQKGIGGWTMSVARRVLEPHYGKRWAQPIFDLSYRGLLARRPGLSARDERIDIFYGADSLIRVKPAASAAGYVCLEHGTVRWIADGARESAVLRRAYRDQVARAAHLWVTNLDPRTLEIAEDVAPGRWSAFPHPYLLDPRVPFAGSDARRQKLLSATTSEFLVLLPSSQNWARTHDKGSIKALTAFVEMRRAGVDVGLVAVEWGLQLAESKAFLADAGVGENVVWVPPMAKLGLQRMMADVDVVWDQFGLDAFGALALRAVEQGTPFVSRGLAPEGERVIGGPVPWSHASSVEEIVAATSTVFDDMGSRGRAVVTAEFRARYRRWLNDRHDPELTAALQHEVYARMIDGSHQRGTATPDRWAKTLTERENEGL